MIARGFLHQLILKHVIEKGFAPDPDTLARLLNTDVSNVRHALLALQEYHGVVLHPTEPKIWVIHPFSLAPTNFLVQTASNLWWGNCAWCSLGIAALIKEDVTITTRLGAYDKQVVIHITNGKLMEQNLFVHFPVAMKKAWDNIIYACSNMLLFESEEQLEAWTRRHRIPKGDMQPIQNIWEFSKRWYGNHLDPNWTKWSMREARQIFQEFNLTHPLLGLRDI
jgi:hypothetical protein